MTKDNIISMPDTDRIEEQASIWVMRLAEGEISRSDSELVSWLAESPQHKDTFDRLSSFWEGLDFAEGLNDYAESDVAKASLRQERMAQRFRVFRPVLVGAIAASAFAVLGGVMFQSNTPEPRYFSEEYQTVVGEQETVDLPDGSQVILNTNSAINVAFSDDSRRITLTRGEAYFDVASNPEKPFSVQTNKGSVTAVGTAFSVRLIEKKLNVVVTEGRVALKTASASIKLNDQQPDEVAPDLVPDTQPLNTMEVSAGQSAVIDQGIEEVSIVQPHMLEKTLDWQDGELSFRGETLEQVIKDIERYTDVRIEIGDEQIREQKIVAYYKVGDVERMFEALNVMANIDVERIAENHVRLYRAN